MQDLFTRNRGVEDSLLPALGRTSGWASSRCGEQLTRGRPAFQAESLGHAAIPRGGLHGGALTCPIFSAAGLESFSTRAEQLSFQAGQVPIELLDSCFELLNGFRLPKDDGMASRKIVGEFHGRGDHHHASLHA